MFGLLFTNLVGSSVVNKPQLAPVKQSAVQISAKGQEALLFHGVPILPRDPPGAVRQAPRFSVTYLKTN